MNITIKILLFIFLGIASGYLISWLARDELVQGRKWFKIILIVFALIGIAGLFFQEIEIALTSAFIFVVTAISLWKSYDKKFIRKK